MKFRYIVRTFVEASSIQEALKLAKTIKPHEVYIDNAWWEKANYPLTEEEKKQIGFKKRRKI